MSECRNNHMQTHWQGCDCSRAADRREARLAALREARQAVLMGLPTHGCALDALDRLIAAESETKPEKEEVDKPPVVRDDS